MKLTRRHVLRGMGGATLALPLLESLLPRRANAQSAAHRFVIFIKNGNGPATAGKGEPETFWPDLPYGAFTQQQLVAQSNRTVSELAPYASRLNIIKGIKFAGVGHGPSSAQMLSGAQFVNVGGGDGNQTPRSDGITVDTYIEKTLKNGQLPLCMWTGPDAGYVGYRLSYVAPRQLAAAEKNPRTVFNRLTQTAGTGNSAAQLTANGRKSVNDLVREELKELRSKAQLSSSDRQKLDMHLDAVRDIEVKLACTIPTDRGQEAEAIASVLNLSWLNDGANNERLVRLQCDLAAFAVACGAHHAVSIQVADCLDSSAHTIPVNGSMKKVHSFHQISHRTYDDGAIGTSAEMAGWHHQIDRLHAQTFRHLLDRLSAHGVLDQGVAVWCFDQGDGTHDPTDSPFILAGTAGGYLRAGQYVNNGGGMNNRILNTLINAMGIRKPGGALVEDFGFSGYPGGELGAIKAS